MRDRRRVKRNELDFTSFCWRGYYFKSQKERERERKKGIDSSFSRVNDFHRLRERSKSLILQDESRSSFCRTIHSSTESSKLTSGTGSTFEVDETEYFFRYSYCDERIDRFVTSCYQRARRESVSEEERKGEERRGEKLTRTNSRFSQFVEGRITINLDLIRIGESSRVSIDLGPVDVEERTLLDLRSVTNLNARFGFANETSNSGIETKGFADVVL